MTSRAWVTLATNDSYGLGALVLAYSLRRVGSTYPAVVLITPSVTDAMRARLQAVFAEVITVNVLDSQDAAHLALLQRPELGITFTKIHCWNLTQYEKCVFLDADILVVQNCDELFEREELSAAPDVGWPDCFNSGVFVFKPSADTFSRLIQFAQERGSFDGGDQGLLNSFFSDWSLDGNKRLPFLYNVTSAAFYSYLPALKHFGQNLKIIHFIGAAKPWLQRYNFEAQSVDAPEHLKGFLQLWWDLFTSQVHPQLDVSMDNLEEPSPASQHDIEENNSELQPTFEQRLDYATYEPTLDPTSEFPWHHPANQKLENKTDDHKLDINEFHDPWDMYRGNILPISSESTKPDEVRKYAWDHTHYASQEPKLTEYNDNYKQNYRQHDSFQNNQMIHVGEQPYENKTQHSYEHNAENYIYETQNFRNDSNNDHNTPTHNTNTGTNEMYEEPQIEYFSDQPLAQYNSSEIHKIKTNILPSSKKNYTYCLHMDYEKPSQIVFNNDIMNGDIYGDSEIYDDIRPRHPYDGFYLRHKTAIDSRGRKLCVHEIPHLPPSPPPESPEYYEDAIDPMDNGFYLERQEDTGVAGNLARVQPGVPLQHEALDELSRRQGWESGNIDYMGADSFANIWAKISQTLNQGASSPPKQPSPPKESPQVLVESASEAVSTLAEKVSSTSLDESNDIPVPAREAANAAGKINEPVSEAEQNINVEVPKISPASDPQLEIESSSVESEVKTESSPAPKETVAAVEESLDTSPTEVPTPVPVGDVPAVVPQPEIPIDACKAVSESIVAAEVPESKPSEPTPPEKPLEKHDLPENEVPKPDVIPEQPVEVHVPEPIAESPIELPKSESLAEASIVPPQPEPISESPIQPPQPEPISESPILPPQPEPISESPIQPPQPEPISESPIESSKSEPVATVPVPATVEAASETLPDIAKNSTTSVQNDTEEPKTELVIEPESKPATESSDDVPTVAVASPTEIKTIAEVPVVPSIEPASVPLPADSETKNITETETAEVKDINVAPAAEAESSSDIPSSVPPSDPNPITPSDNIKPESDSAPEVPKQVEAPEKADPSVSDSPPLANTPSQEEVPSVAAAKLEERRKPVAKLQLKPPTAADPLPTPDSELEDAATLAQSIIASELRTPTVTSASPTAGLASPQLQTQPQRLDVKSPDVPTPPVGAVSLSQIGVKSKSKPTTASQIESSVAAKAEAEPPKKKLVKKVVKKDGASSGEAPVPPPRKKEKKPKESK